MSQLQREQETAHEETDDQTENMRVMAQFRIHELENEVKTLTKALEKSKGACKQLAAELSTASEETRSAQVMHLTCPLLGTHVSLFV
jgi:type IV secretory pathway VirJ component